MTAATHVRCERTGDASSRTRWAGIDGGHMKRFVLAIPVLALALGGTTACATKKFVRGEVGQVNEKVDTLTKSVEENQERTRANEQRIGEVDQKAAAADQRAQQAGARADEAKTAADAVNTRADAIERASKRLI